MTMEMVAKLMMYQQIFCVRREELILALYFFVIFIVFVTNVCELVPKKGVIYYDEGDSSQLELTADQNEITKNHTENLLSYIRVRIDNVKRLSTQTMFQTLGYFLELSVSIYFFCVVTLFLINVCEFMPLTAHDDINKKTYIQPPKRVLSTPKTVTSEPAVEAQKGARKSKSKDKLKPDRSKSSVRSAPTVKEKKEETEVNKEQSPEQAEKPAEATEESQNPEAAAQEETAAPTAAEEQAAQADAADGEPGETAAPNETAEPAESTAPTETAEPAESTAPTETTEPAESTAPTESAEPAETTATTEATEPTEANATDPESEANG